MTMRFLAFPALILTVGLALASPAAAQDVDDDSQPMTFTIAKGADCDGCRWIAAEGDIMDDSNQALGKLLKNNPDAADLVVRFDSPGGSLWGSIQLGEEIRSRGLRTEVAATKLYDADDGGTVARTGKGECASACAYAFLGGVTRAVPDGSKFGVHQFYGGRQADDEAIQQVVAELGIYILEMGVDGDLVIAAAATSPNGMHWLNRDELEGLKVVTDVMSPAEATWQFAQSAGALYLTSSQTQQDGSVTEYQVSCAMDSPRSLQVLARSQVKPLPEDKAIELTWSIRGLGFKRESGKVGDMHLAIVAMRDRKLEIGGVIDREDFAHIVADKDRELYVDVDAPNEVSRYLSDKAQRFPLANLGGALPVLLRNCL